MKANLKIVSCYNLDSNPSFIVQFDTAKYLFNCGEGTQRICVENGIKLAKLKGIILTRRDWSFAGGIAGMILTIADSVLSGLKPLALIGPTGISQMMAGCRSFLKRKNIDLASIEPSESGDFEYSDENLTLKGYSLSGDAKIDTQNRPLYDKILKSMFGLDSNTFTHFSPPCTKLDGSHPVCYVGQCPTIRGKFDPKIARALGVKKGPDFGRLAEGNDIEIDGKLILSSQCVGPSRTGPVFVIIDCPNISYIQVLARRMPLLEYLNSTINPPKFIIHIASKEVLESKDYCKLFSSTGSKTKNIVFAEGVHPMEYVFNSATDIFQSLTQLDPELFPPIHKNACKNLVVNGLQNSHLPTPNEEFHLVPALSVISSPKQSNRREISVPPVLCDPYLPTPKLYESVKIIPLGTASSLPGKYRNVSGTLVELLDACILLDCGEGTLGQLSRRYGDRLDSVLKTLKLIFISHMHADHHLGLFAVLKAAKAVGAAVFIVGPSYLSNWINEYSCLEDLGEYTFYDCEEFVGSHKFKPTPNLPDAISKISTTPVVHCEKSYAVVIVTTDGFKLGFSGDCRPDEKFAQLGNGCDLLIHEATFDDSMHEEALKKLHSTVTEAIDIGLAMKAKYLLLTHFSSRYKFPEMKDIAKSPLDGLIVGIAQDLMYIQMDQFWKLPLYSDSLKNVNMASESADVEKVPAKKLKNSQCNFES